LAVRSASVSRALAAATSEAGIEQSTTNSSPLRRAIRSVLPKHERSALAMSRSASSPTA